MTTQVIQKAIENKKKEIEKLNKEIIELQRDLESQGFITITCRQLKKEFRIYKWEKKQFKDFPMPKGFDWCEYISFVYLYDNNLIKLEKYPVCYYIKNQSEKNVENGWSLSRLYLGRDLVLYSNYEYLAFSDDDGRVVVERRLK